MNQPPRVGLPFYFNFTLGILLIFVGNSTLLISLPDFDDPYPVPDASEWGLWDSFFLQGVNRTNLTTLETMR